MPTDLVPYAFIDPNGLTHLNKLMWFELPVDLFGAITADTPHYEADSEVAHAFAAQAARAPLSSLQVAAWEDRNVLSPDQLLTVDIISTRKDFDAGRGKTYALLDRQGRPRLTVTFTPLSS